MEMAGLTDLLKQEGEYTLFAPSDEAFAGVSDSDMALLRGWFISQTLPLSPSLLVSLSLSNKYHSQRFSCQATSWWSGKTADLNHSYHSYKLSPKGCNVKGTSIRLRVGRCMYDMYYGSVVFHLKPCLFWPGNMNALRTILLYHFSNGVFIGGGLETGVTNLLKSLQGNNLRVLHVSPNLSTLNRAVNIRNHGIMAATKPSKYHKDPEEIIQCFYSESRDSHPDPLSITNYRNPLSSTM